MEELKKEFEEKFGRIAYIKKDKFTIKAILNIDAKVDEVWQWIEDKLANRLEPEVDVKTAELKEALQDATLHFTQRTFSIRPCETCDLVSEIIKKPFGCKDLRKINDSRFSD